MSWYEIGTLDTRNDVGDTQAGQAFSRRFARPTVGGYAVADIHYYAATDDPHTRGARPGEYWVGLDIEYTTCTDPARPGDTETSSAGGADDSDRRRHVYRTLRDAERRAEKLAKGLRPRDIDDLVRQAVR
ncbi:hypothetical protein RM844_30265 [Streptomyces sp. DSM 44915]|uniref:Uncharacterized protein n=1 Tax=Streptomyces chisholmiae TaxID=3075540 RepID=A0ABU2JZY7_9ACTN|nr:hypothetical protein [Streptomyces sp. DSM 44915]MDT0270566.1 hypothetical protein [Streptomyces sp. DSM 44915]